MEGGGGYVTYNLYGNLFEVSTKYGHPLRPIGRGASGLVWFVPLFLLFASLNSFLTTASFFSWFVIPDYSKIDALVIDLQLLCLMK